MNNDNSKMFYISLIMMIVFVFFGSFLILSPESTISLISKTLAALIFLISLSGFIRYFMRLDKSQKFDYNLAYAIITLIFAVILFLKDDAIGILIPPVLGIFMLSNTSLKINEMARLKKEKNNLYKVVAIMMLIEYLSSFMVIFNVFGQVLTINQIVGIFVIFYFVLDFVLVYLLKVIYEGNRSLKVIEEVNK